MFSLPPHSFHQSSSISSSDGNGGAQSACSTHVVVIGLLAAVVLPVCELQPGVRERVHERTGQAPASHVVDVAVREHADHLLAGNRLLVDLGHDLLEALGLERVLGLREQGADLVECTILGQGCVDHPGLVYHLFHSPQDLGERLEHHELGRVLVSQLLLDLDDLLVPRAVLLAKDHVVEVVERLPAQRVTAESLLGAEARQLLVGPGVTVVAPATHVHAAEAAQLGTGAVASGLAEPTALAVHVDGPGQGVRDRVHATATGPAPNGFHTLVGVHPLPEYVDGLDLQRGHVERPEDVCLALASLVHDLGIVADLEGEDVADLGQETSHDGCTSHTSEAHLLCQVLEQDRFLHGLVQGVGALSLSPEHGKVAGVRGLELVEGEGDVACGAGIPVQLTERLTHSLLT